VVRTDRLRLPGYDFVDPGLLAQALTHRSAAALHNERLEFLGDALVNLFVAEALYTHWPKADEGTLTRARAELVRESSLATIARTLGLGEHLILGPGEMKSGGHRRDSILADAVEAIVGAIYFDAGFAKCRASATSTPRPSPLSPAPSNQPSTWALSTITSSEVPRITPTPLVAFKAR